MSMFILMAMLAGAPDAGDIKYLGEGTLVLDAEPLASGVCSEDVKMYRQAFMDVSRRVVAAETNPTWGVLFGLSGGMLLLGVLLGVLGADAQSRRGL